MLKTPKRIDDSSKPKVAKKRHNRSVHHAETEMSSLFNIDPYPEFEVPPKIDLKLQQLEDFE